MMGVQCRAKLFHVNAFLFTLEMWDAVSLSERLRGGQVGQGDTWAGGCVRTQRPQYLSRKDVPEPACHHWTHTVLVMTCLVIRCAQPWYASWLWPSTCVSIILCQGSPGKAVRRGMGLLPRGTSCGASTVETHTWVGLSGEMGGVCLITHPACSWGLFYLSFLWS